FGSGNTRSFRTGRCNTKSHHRLAIACLAAAAIERVLEAIWTIQNEIWYNTKSHHRLAIARLAAAAIERILEAVWTI
ncbi:MAG: hypothetical protein LBT90_01580, partial [Holosporaceae bacterium]|nr:hypothetical protein [Holosporaceae bacterium]